LDLCVGYVVECNLGKDQSGCEDYLGDFCYWSSGSNGSVGVCKEKRTNLKTCADAETNLTLCSDVGFPSYLLFNYVFFFFFLDAVAVI
jgi:hypothetical protein